MIQIAAYRRLRSSVRQRRQTPARHYLQRQLRTEFQAPLTLRPGATDLAQLQEVYGTPGGRNPGSNRSTIADRRSGPVDQPGFAVGAHRAVRRRADPGPAAQYDDARHPELACQRRDGHQRSVTRRTTRWPRSRSSTSSFRAAARPMPRRRRCWISATRTLLSCPRLMDIRTVVNDLNQVTVFTNSGVQLVGTEAAQLSFNPQGTMTPNTLYSLQSDQEQCRHHHRQFPAWRQLRSGVDQLIRSGKIAAYLELRDNTLVKAQAQVDQFAASMASALSDKTTAGTLLRRRSCRRPAMTSISRACSPATSSTSPKQHHRRYA